MTDQINEDERDISLEARYPQFYRQQGIRYPMQLKDPRLYPYSELQSIDFITWHYHIPKGEGSTLTYGVSQNNPLLGGSLLKNGSWHIQDNPISPKGSVKKKVFNYRLAIKAYHKHNNEIYWIRKEEQLKGLEKRRPWNLIIDYSLMGRNIEFRPNPMRFIHEFEWQYQGYLSGIRDIIAKGSKTRHHFIFFHVPDSLPTISQTRMAANELKRAYWKLFSGYKQLAYLDFWKWLDPNARNQSFFDKYIKEKDYELIDIVFSHKNHASVLNLNLLNKWITGKEAFDDDNDVETDEEDGESGVSQSTARRFQKRFWGFLNTIITRLRDDNKQLTEEIDEWDTTYIEKTIETHTDATLKDDDITDIETVVEVADPSMAVKQTLSDVLKVQDEEDDADDEDDSPRSTSVDVGDDGYPETEDEDRTPRHIHDGYHAASTSKKVVPLSTLVDLFTKKHTEDEAKAFGYSDREEKHWLKVSETYKKIPSPDGISGKTLEDFINEDVDKSITEEEISLPDIPMCTDKSMLKTSIKVLDKKYIKKHLHRDIAKSIVSVQKTGLNITEYKVERVKDVASDYEIHTFQVTPTGGSPSTIHMKLPVIHEDGTMTLGSTKFSLRQMRIDKPIRKVADNKVSLTSYYGKIFMNRCEKRKFNQRQWIQQQIDLLTMDKLVSGIVYGTSVNKVKNLPPVLHEMSQLYQSLTFHNPPFTKPVTIDFSQIVERGDVLTIAPQLQYNTKRGVWIYQNKAIENPFGFDINQMPVTYAEMSVMGETLPVGWVLARQYGFAGLVETLGLQPEKYDNGKHIERHPWQLIVRFADEKWVFDKRTMTVRDQLIIGGMNAFAKNIKSHSVYDFSTPDVFGAIMQEEGYGVRTERECDLMTEMFVDPMTYDVLVKMGEPTDFHELLIRGVELLASSHHVDEINMDDMLIKGYERVAGGVYRNLVRNLRQFKSKAITHKRRFDMRPDDVILELTSDPTCEVSDEINPIQNIKEKTNVTYIGEGGRSKRSMSKRTRGYHESDMGVISEAGVDSGDVGITTFMSSNPQFTDTMGNTKRLDDNKNTGAIYSTSILSSPFSTHDTRYMGYR